MTGSKWASDSGTFDHTPSKEEKDDLLRTAMSLTGRFVYKKDTLECFCFHCQKYFNVDKKMFKQARYSKVCPNCYQPVTYHVKEDWAERKWIALKGIWGYSVYYSWKWGEEPTTSIRQVMYFNAQDGLFYRKGISIGMGYILCECEEKGWRPIKADKYGYMPNYTYFFNDIGIPEEMTRKEYYERIGIRLKSDQVKLASQNVWSKEQLMYMKAFDLHEAEDVEKYSGYMKKNPIDGDVKLNVHYLRYLAKNKIRLSDYIDYMSDCKFLGLKLDKPKDFQERHRRYSERVDEIRNKGVDDKIRKRAKKLIKTSFDDGDFTITPIGSRAELKDTAKHLHNCMLSYAKRYADGETNLYVMRSKGIDIVAIEIKDKKLRQARADHNGECPKEIRRLISRWCAGIKVKEELETWY